MYPYMNEDAAFERLKDMQREMETARLWAGGSRSLLVSGRRLAERAWILAGLAMRRAPRRKPIAVQCDESTAVDAA